MGGGTDTGRAGREYSHARLKDMIKIGARPMQVYRDSKIIDTENPSLSLLAHHSPRTNGLFFVHLTYDGVKGHYDLSCSRSFALRHDGGEHYQMEDLVWVQDRDLSLPVGTFVNRFRNELNHRRANYSSKPGSWLRDVQRALAKVKKPRK